MKNIKKKRKRVILLLVTSLIILLCYAPPVCLHTGLGTSHPALYLNGPGEMYSIESLIRRNKLPLVVIYFIFLPNRINTPCSSSLPPLSLAAREAKFTTVRYLMLMGADVNIDNFSPFSSALGASGRKKLADRDRIIRYMIENGLEVNPKDGEQTPLALAAANCDTKVMKLLLDRGADVNTAAASGLTPLLYALKHECGSCELFDLLVKKGADVNATDDLHNTALHYVAAKMGMNYGLSACLIDRGIDINAQNSEGNTFLHRMSWIGSSQIVELALDKGADPNIRNHDGFTPLGLALQRKTSLFSADRRQATVIKLLLNHGAVE